MSLSGSLLIKITIGLGLVTLILVTGCQNINTSLPTPTKRHPGALGQGKHARVHIIKMDTKDNQHVFEPERLHIKSGEKVRWINVSDGHSATAYNPKNNMQYLSRIPVGAKPWDSGVIDKPNQTFEYTFIKEGVYQYYCIPHEGEGMVGTIVVGKAVNRLALKFIQKQIPEAARKKLSRHIN